MGDACAYLKIYDVNEYPGLMAFNRLEIMRYAGMARTWAEASDRIYDMEDVGNLSKIMEECIKEVIPVLSYKVSYRFDSIQSGIPFDTHGSKDILTNLEGCDEIVLFAATVGIGIDRLITKYSHISPVKALFMQAIGAERIETLCDIFNKEVSEGKISGATSKTGVIKTKPRYSPGYGDLPLDVQKEFFALLDCGRRLGLTLNDSLLMSPSKSVTAFIGIMHQEENDDPKMHTEGCDDFGKKREGREHGDIQETGDTYSHSADRCASCGNLDCEYRIVK